LVTANITGVIQAVLAAQLVSRTGLPGRRVEVERRKRVIAAAPSPASTFGR